LTKKTSNIYKWKEKVQKNTGRRRKVQVTIAAFKGCVSEQGKLSGVKKTER